jgi:hypothetical protein
MSDAIAGHEGQGAAQRAVACGLGLLVLLAGACTSPRNVEEFDAGTGGAGGGQMGGNGGTGAKGGDAGLGGAGGAGLGGAGGSDPSGQPHDAGGGGATGGAPSGVGGGGGQPAGADAATNPGNDDRTLHVNVAGMGRVTASMGGIDCPGSCDATLARGTAVTLTAKADAGNRFAGWSGACSGTGPCQITLDATTSVGATFEDAIAWQQPVAFGGAVAVAGNAIYVAGAFENTQDFGGMSATSKGMQDGFLAKYDADGKIQWLKSFGGSEWDDGISVAVSPTGEVALAGRFHSAAVTVDGQTLSGQQGQENFFIAWFDGNGARLATAADEGGYAITYDSGGNLIASGASIKTRLSKWSPSHQRLWKTAEPEIFLGQKVAVDGAGNIFLAVTFFSTIHVGGKAYTSLGDRDTLLLKFAPGGGNALWGTTFAGSLEVDANGMAADAAGDVYTVLEYRNDLKVGGFSLRSVGGYDVMLAKIAGADGTALWAKNFGSSGDDFSRALTLDKQGNPMIAAAYGSGTDLGAGAVSQGGTSLIRFSPGNGSFTSLVPIPGVTYGIAQHDSGDFIVVGSSLARVRF